MSQSTLYKVRTTVIEMLTDRGYRMDPNINFEDFKIMYSQNNMDLQDKDSKIHIFFYNETKSLSKKDLEVYYNQATGDSANPDIGILIIVRDKLNSIVNRELDKELYHNIEIFTIDQLKINITKYNGIPKHIPLSAEQEAEMLARYGIVKNQIPKVRSSDPICRYFHLKHGRIIRVIRNSPTSGEAVSYRCVI